MIHVEKTIHAFDITPDGTRIVTVSYYNDVDSFDIFDIKSGNCLNTIAVPFSSRFNMVFALSGDSQKLITGVEMLVRVWNLATLECQRTFQGHESDIRSLGSSHDSSRVASVDKRSQMMIWDTVTGERLRVISAYNVISLKFNFDATHVVFLEHISRVCILDIAKGGVNHVSAWGRSLTINAVETINAVDFCYGGNFWNRRIQYLHCGFLRDTHTSVIAASTKNPDLPFLPTEIWEHIFEFIPIQDSVITASVKATATIIHL
jgi:hypothetical protein